MTDSPDTADDHTTASQGTSDSPFTAETPTARGGSVWSKLNRTNRILTIVLGASLAVLIVGVAFGVGVLVGAEAGGYGGDGGSSEHNGEHWDSHHGQDGRAQDAGHSDDQGGAGESADADRAGPSDQSAVHGAPAGSGIEPSAAPGPPR